MNKKLKNNTLTRRYTHRGAVIDSFESSEELIEAGKAMSRKRDRRYDLQNAENTKALKMFNGLSKEIKIDRLSNAILALRHTLDHGTDWEKKTAKIVLPIAEKMFNNPEEDMTNEINNMEQLKPVWFENALNGSNQ